MKLNLENFFSELIFHPFKANTKKDKTIALVASIALGVFSVGICHAVCAIRNHFTHRPIDKSTDQDDRVSRQRDSALGTQTSNTSSVVDEVQDSTNEIVPIEIKVTIDPVVKKVLEDLFKDSSYSIDELPIYPIILNKEIVKPKRSEMIAAIMKGACDDGRAFIAIKMDCTISESESEEIYANCDLNTFNIEKKSLREQKKILFLSQYHSNGPLSYGGDGKWMWSQFDLGGLMTPLFFTSNFTYPDDGTGPTDSQIENFKLLQAVLKSNEGPDRNGLIWRIPSQ